MRISEVEKKEAVDAVAVVIADSDREFALELSRSINNREELAVVGGVYSGDMVNHMLRSTGAQVLIVDMILPMLDGLGVLKRLEKLEKGPELVVMTSAMAGQALVRKASELGADYFVQKPADAEELADKVEELCRMFLPETGAREAGAPARVSEPKIEVLPRRPSPVAELASLLDKIGIRPKLKGYVYLKESVLIAAENRNSISNISKDIYSIVAKRHGATEGGVERCIRNSIMDAWNIAKWEQEGYGWPANTRLAMIRPSNAELIAILADRINMIDGGDNV